MSIVLLKLLVDDRTKRNHIFMNSGGSPANQLPKSQADPLVKTNENGNTYLSFTCDIIYRCSLVHRTKSIAITSHHWKAISHSQWQTSNKSPIISAKNSKQQALDSHNSKLYCISRILLDRLCYSVKMDQLHFCYSNFSESHPKEIGGCALTRPRAKDILSALASRASNAATLVDSVFQNCLRSFLSGS